MAIRIRPYRESDAVEVGLLIAETFRRFNLYHATPEEQSKLLGPFRHAGSENPDHRRAVADVLRAPLVLVALDEQAQRIVGVLRGRAGRLHSLFVAADWHRRGIGRRLMDEFEKRVRAAGNKKITLQSTLHAIPFYERLGYKRSTGVRSGPCFDGDGFRYQPMKKAL